MAILASHPTTEKSTLSFTRGLNLGAGAAAAAFVSLCLVGVIRNYSPVPISDDWNGYLGFNLDLLDGKVDAWWGVYGSHVPIIPRVLYFLDFHFFGARRVFMIVAAMLAQAACTATLIVYAREQIVRRGLFAVSSLLIVLAFAWTQMPNFFKGYNGDVFFPQALFAVGGFYSLHRAKENSAWFALALLAGIAAAGTNANGFLLLPVMAAMSAAIGLSIRRTVLIILISAALFILYFLDFKFHGVDADYQIASLDIARDPVQIALFALTYLGSPFYFVVSYWLAGLQHAVGFLSGATSFVVHETLDDYSAARMVGVISATLAGGCLVALSAWSALNWFKQKNKSTSEAALLALLLFLFLSAGAAAVGRGTSGFGYAVQERYTTPALLGWQALMILLLGRLHLDTLMCALKVMVVVVPLALLPHELRVIVKADPLAQVRLDSLRSLQTGTSDDPLIAPVLPRLRARGIDLLK